jgi:hypothetical protein
MPDNYGMTEAQLRRIINATEEAFGQITGVQHRVEGQAQYYIAVNHSQSGRIMQEALGEWTSECNQIGGALHQLNERVTGVLNENIATNERAAEHAKHHHGGHSGHRGN